MFETLVRFNTVVVLFLGGSTIDPITAPYGSGSLTPEEQSELFRLVPNPIPRSRCQDL